MTESKENRQLRKCSQTYVSINKKYLFCTTEIGKDKNTKRQKDRKTNSLGNLHKQMFQFVKITCFVPQQDRKTERQKDSKTERHINTFTKIH